MSKRLQLFLPGIFICLLAQAQYFNSKAYPTDYFRSPLGIPLQLSANFGEVRTNHYHMGLDIRTNQRENLPVYAAADGFVSRVKIEQYGYGRVIYITHPAGYVTVYAHLNEFYSDLDKYVIDKQYRDEQWEQDIYFYPNQFPISKGQFIANSGNTGGSAGPHLHFEIRDSKTGNNINPWFFNFNIPDRLPPTISGFYYYDRRYSTYKTTPNRIELLRKGNGYVAKDKVVLLPTPQISFAIKADDKTNNSPFRFGIYQAEVSMDGALQFAFQLDDFSYDDSRYVNGEIDFQKRATTKEDIQHLSRLPGSHVPIFGKGLSDGVFTLTDEQPHTFEVVVKDAAGNSTRLSFTAQYNPKAQKERSFIQNYYPLIPNQFNKITQDNIEVFFSEKAVYDTVPFVLSSQMPKGDGHPSEIFSLHNYTIPVHDSFTVRLKNKANLPSALLDKVVVHLKSNRKTEAIKGDWKNGWMEARFWDLGDVRLLVDTFPPSVSTSGWSGGANLGGRRSISLLVTDDEGDIKSFRAELDGKWLMFSRKSDYYIHQFDERTTPGSHTLKIWVEDIAGNITEKTYTFAK